MAILNTPVLTKEFVTPLGQMLGAASNDGLFFLGFSDTLTLGYDLRKAMKLIGGYFGEKKNCKGNDILQALEKEIKEYFNRERTAFSIPFVLTGTNFQKSIWGKLNSIPYGEKWSYSQLAESIGNPLAFRAVGTTNSRNRIPIVIPCHRVTLKNGSIGGYSGGVWRKKFLLELENTALSSHPH